METKEAREGRRAFTVCFLKAYKSFAAHQNLRRFQAHRTGVSISVRKATLVCSVSVSSSATPRSQITQGGIRRQVRRSADIADGCCVHLRQDGGPVFVATPSYFPCMQVTPVARHTGLVIGSNGGRVFHSISLSFRVEPSSAVSTHVPSFSHTIASIRRSFLMVTLFQQC